MDEQPEDALRAVAQDPEDLDGHTVEQLADYLDAGRTPPDPTIESSAACRHALAALERLRNVASAALLVPPDRADDGDAEEDGWVAGVMGRIALDAHAGADFPLSTADPDTVLVMTEGALRALVRAAGDDRPEFLVGRVRFEGDLSAPAEPVTIAVDATVLHGVQIPAAVDRLREEIRAEVVRHTDLSRVRVDVAVQDLQVPGAGSAA